MNTAPENILAKLPFEEISKSMENHNQPFLGMLPDKRMKAVIEQMVLGILGGQTPLITGMARPNTKEAERPGWLSSACTG